MTWAFITGFKLDTLLKLADVKGTDRRTSLLHFVLLQLMKENQGLKSLPQQLGQSKAAANLQVCPTCLLPEIHARARTYTRPQMHASQQEMDTLIK